MKANASKHKAMSYERMSEAEKKLSEEVTRLLAEAERVDAEEDALHGKGKRGDELPKELKRREDRLLKIAKPKRSSSARRKRGRCGACRSRSQACGARADSSGAGKEGDGREARAARPGPGGA